jgi:spore maturation protein CgeB
MTAAADPTCELCQAARFTEWFYEDDECWIAECESCSVPMVVWRVHDPHPSDDVKAMLHERLAAVMADVFEDPHVVDDNLRTIPTHYHAHARPRSWGRGFRRRRPAGA